MRKLEYNRSADFHRAANPLEKLYYSAGIPSANWKSFVSMPSYELITYDDKVITPDTQSQWYTKFLSNPALFQSPYLVMIGSMDYDEPACALAYELVKKALVSTEIGSRVQITNACATKDDDIRNEIVFMLYNVYDNASEDRIQNIRDWIYTYQENFRIIALCGDPAVLAKRCRIKPHALLYVKGMLNNVKQFY